MHVSGTNSSISFEWNHSTAEETLLRVSGSVWLSAILHTAGAGTTAHKLCSSHPYWRITKQREESQITLSEIKTRSIYE